MHALALVLATAIAPLDSAPVMVVGHRGAPAELPESTLAGFAFALDHGAGIELDVRVTHDGVIVVHHDAHVHARCAPHAGERIAALTFRQLRHVDCGARDPSHPNQRALPGAQIPSLDEVLAVVASSPRGGRVLLELKADDTPAPDAFARLLVPALDRARVRARVVVESFDPALVEAVRHSAPTVARGLLCGTCDGSTLSRAKSLGAILVSPAHDRIDRAFVDDAHARGLGVYAWTANDASAWTRLRALGVDAIITDDPRALQAAP